MELESELGEGYARISRSDTAYSGFSFSINDDIAVDVRDSCELLQHVGGNIYMIRRSQNPPPHDEYRNF